MNPVGQIEQQEEQEEQEEQYSWVYFQKLVKKKYSDTVSFGCATEKQEIFDVNAIKERLSKDYVVYLIKTAQEHHSGLSEKEKDDLVEMINDDNKTIFAIAVYSSTQLKCLKEILKTENDNSLPLTSGSSTGHVNKTSFIAHQAPFCVHMIKGNCYNLEFNNHRFLPITYDEEADSLGEGYTANVYSVRISKGWHDFSTTAPNFNRFAMKVIHKPDKTDREERFLRDTREIRHKNLTKCYSAFYYRDFYYIISERATCNLETVLKMNPNEVQNEIWLRKQMQGLAGALKRVHFIDSTRTGYIHDIKPENILAFEDDGWTLKLADWGCAKVSELTVKGSHESLPKINPTYLPPESPNGSQPTSRPHDIFSLGCVFLQMSVWIHDFSALGGLSGGQNGQDDGFWEGTGENKELRAAVKNQLLESSEIPFDLVKIIKLMLQIDPTERINAQRLVKMLGNLGKSKDKEEKQEEKTDNPN